MTKTEAIEAVKSGAVISHDCFNPYEYIRLDGTELIDERSNTMNFTEFWKDRQLDIFQTGWRVYDKTTEINVKNNTQNIEKNRPRPGFYMRPNNRPLYRF